MHAGDTAVFSSSDRGIHLTVFCAGMAAEESKADGGSAAAPLLTLGLPATGGGSDGGGRSRSGSEAMRSHSVQYEHADLWAVALAFTKAWNAHDAMALSRCWKNSDTDADLVSASGLRATGRKEIAALFAPDFAEGGALHGSTYHVRVSHVKMLGGPASGLALVDWETSVDGVTNSKTGMPVPASSCGVAVICERAQGGATNGETGSAWEITSVRPQG